MHSIVQRPVLWMKYRFARFRGSSEISNFDFAIALGRKMLEHCPPGHPGRPTCLTDLSTGLVARYQQLGHGKDLEEAILFDREALALYQPRNSDPFILLNKLAEDLFARYNHFGAIEDLEEAITLDRDALVFRPPHNPARSITMSNLALHLSTQYRSLGDMKDLEEAIILARDSQAVCSQDGPNRSALSANLAHCLFSRYRQLGKMEDLQEAIILEQGALALRPRDHSYRSTSLNNLARQLSTRYGELGKIPDLEAAIFHAREALTLCSPSCPARSTSSSILASCLCIRYGQVGNMEDLEAAVILAQEALVLCPPSCPHRSTSLSTLARCISTRYRHLGAIDDLQEAIGHEQGALALRPPGHPSRPVSLNNLAALLCTRYNRHGDKKDLEKAIILGQEALALCPEGHPDRSISLYGLADCVITRYRQLKRLKDLDDAIALNRAALALHPLGNPKRPLSLTSLADCLSTRYEQLGVMKDLDEAILLDQEALLLCPTGHSNRPTSLHNFADDIFTRYWHCGSPEDLDNAIAYTQEVQSLLPPGNPFRSKSLNNLAAYYSTRYERLGMTNDLDEAINIAREAVRLRPPEDPYQSTALNNLALHLSVRYRHSERMGDLEEAIFLHRNALALCPLGHPRRGHSLHCLAYALRIRATKLSKINEQDTLFNVYSELAHVPQVVSLDDLSATKAWIYAAEDFQHPTTLLAYETSLLLLVRYLATLPSLPQNLDILKKLASSLAMDAFSACLRNHSPVKAIELLEQGRGVFWSQLARLRSPVDDVIASCPRGEKLANEFTQLTALIRTVFDSPGTDQHERACHLNVELERVVADIHELPGLSRFLLPLQFTDLQQAASGGPVIIVNASKHGCDALVVLLDRDPVHIPLQITRDRVRDMSAELHTWVRRARTMSTVTRYLVEILRKLWETVVCPISEFLQTIIPHQSRIWWCPTAEFSLLPLHAAGSYRKGEAKLTDFYISSYAPTLTSLIHARRNEPSDPMAKEKHFVAIGQAKPTGHSELHSVNAELTYISQRIRDLATLTRIEGPESSISRVTEELRKNEWVHLACHGLPNREQPFEAAFALHDRHFTVEHIIRCKLLAHDPQFAYLSACHTTVGDEQNPDEMIHLASALQFAGFRSVIGTMWAVDDRQTNKIASMFYDRIVDVSGCLDYTRAAFALHQTTQTLKDVAFDQRILYVHLGA